MKLLYLCFLRKCFSSLYILSPIFWVSDNANVVDWVFCNRKGQKCEEKGEEPLSPSLVTTAAAGTVCTKWTFSTVQQTVCL